MCVGGGGGVIVIHLWTILCYLLPKPYDISILKQAIDNFLSLVGSQLEFFPLKHHFHFEVKVCF